MDDYDRVTYLSPGPPAYQIPAGAPCQNVVYPDGSVRPIALSDYSVANRLVMPGAQPKP